MAAETAKEPDVFDKIKLDVFDGLDVFDVLEPEKLKAYQAPPRVSLAMSDEIRALIKAEIRQAVSEAVRGVEPRKIETKTIERVIERIIPSEKIIIKEKLDEDELQKTIDQKIKKAHDQMGVLFVPAPPIIPNWSDKAGKVLSNNGDQLRWIDAPTGTSGGGSTTGTNPFSAYSVANVSTRVGFDAIDISIDELANVIGSLLTQFKIGAISFDPTNTTLDEVAAALNSTLLIAGGYYITSNFTATNVTTTRSYDATATSLEELAHVVGSLIQSLSSTGRSTHTYVALNVTSKTTFDASDTSVEDMANVLGAIISTLQGAGTIQ